MSVTWVLNGSSKYEISSKEHLLQLMTQGTLYTDAGSPPADYWDGDYEQTVDIDLAADANIAPIGTRDDSFTGTYDGSNFSISNWSFSGTGLDVGLFGRTGSTLQNIRLKGVWVVSDADANSNVGFVVGSCSSTTLRNIECTFDKGTTISSNSTLNRVGGIVGEATFGPAYGLTIKGTIALNIPTSTDCVGGVFGFSSGGNISGIRNAAVWTNGLNGKRVGGLAGIQGRGVLTHAVNAMVGDITGESAGGLIGLTEVNLNGHVTMKALNSMRGTITGSIHAGGLVGEADNDYDDYNLTDGMNYMTGDIVCTHSTNPSGGFIGLSSNSKATRMSNCINAMNGTVDDATAGTLLGNAISMKIDTSFGLTYTTAIAGSLTDTFTGTTSTLIPELSYIPMTFTDNASNSYEYEVVFGNVGGNATYSQYTHAVISKDDIAGPYFIDFDLTANTTEYLTYMDVDSSSAFTDASLTILDSSAGVVKDYAGNTLYPIVVWVLDANSKYEISSKEHLIQLMHEGTLYTNEGSVPTDWRLSSYIQTADIDLEGDSTNIVPIWCGGGYDGNGFTVFNWVYVEPSYPSTPTVDHVGFFDRTYSNAVVKNFRMAGVCSISGFKTQAAFVSSYFLESSSVYNIEVDLSPGSFIQNTNSSSFNTRIGGVCAYIATTGTVTDVTLKGELTITPSTNANTTSTMGGIAGDIVNSGPCTLLRNLATFPNPLKGQLAGGITGRIYRTSVTKVLNAMTGDITQNPVGSYIGGIAGLVIQNVVSETSEFVNSMKGNITCNATNSHCAGMFGYLVQDSGATIHSMFNYMTGDITNTFRSSNAAGLVSLGNANTNLTTSINAMNGQVRMPTTNEPSSGAESNIDISFGLTYDIERNITTTPLGLPTDPEVGLPIFDFIATDPDSVVHTFEFVFGNLPRVFNQFQITSADVYISMAELEIYDMTGTNIALLGTASSNASQNASHAPRGNDGNTDPDFSSGTVTDLYLSTGGVTWTLDLDREYTLSEINKVVFYNRATSQERAIGSTIAFNSPDGGAPEQVGVLTSDSIQEFVVTPAPEFLLPTPRVSSISATVVEVAGAFAYRITVTDVAAGSTSTAHNGISTGDVTIRRLSPETNYVLQLFANSGSGYELVDTENVTTLANSPSNYDKTTFGSNGKFDLTTLDDSSFALLGEVMNDVFTTGEELEINIGARKSKVAFVKRGESVSTDDSILAPFSSTAGSGQAFTMNLSDSSAVSVAYDETTNSLDIGGATVEVGGSIVIDGKKLTASDV